MPDISSPTLSPSTAIDATPFRLSEKYYKSRQTPGNAVEIDPTQHRRRRVRAARLKQDTKPSLAGRGVLDLSRREDDEVSGSGWVVDEDIYGGREVKQITLRASEKGKERAQQAFILADGIILLPSYLSPSSQLQLLRASLAEYTLPPNPLSLSTHYALPSLSSQSFFSLYATESTQHIPSLAELQARLSAGDSSREGQVSTPSLTPSSNLSRSSSWKSDHPSPNLHGKTAAELMKELRWCNLGHVYNWTNKAYDFSHDPPIQFPADLAETCGEIVKNTPWEDVIDEKMEHVDWGRWGDDYMPDTGIVNFYQLKDTLMGHVDRAEVDPYRPLISLSLGHACIFLLGSTTRDTEPIPLILRSGDVLLMSGKGRRFYHGVPRVMEGTLPKHFQSELEDDETMKACKKFISTARININARQVFPPGN